MTIDNVLEILEKHKLHIPSNVFYELKADIVNFEEPTTKNDLGVDCISRKDVLKLMQDNWHTHNGDWAMQESMDDIRALPSVTPQEPFKPMVEIDLDYVIKQKYIEREVLDKIRAEIKHFMYDVNPSSSESDYACNYILDILDKYKAERERQKYFAYLNGVADGLNESRNDVNSVLDSIRAEIEFEVDHRTNMLCAEDVFAILDKYKADRSVEE